jgi:hypothetical protein
MRNVSRHTVHSTQRIDVGENHKNLLLKYVSRQQHVTDTNLLQCLHAPT